MKTFNVDVVVIGAGTAGMTAYRELKKHGKNVVLIEGGNYGTTCARVGCMPSKLLIAAADAAHQMTSAPAMGVRAENIHIDGKAVMRRVQQERDRFVNFVVEDVQGFDYDDRVQGYARFIDKNTLQVDEHTTIKTQATIIATGSSPFIPDMFQALGDRLVINDDIFDWDDLPESVAVFGAGVIGLELGQALAHLGVRVQLFSKGGRIANLSDPEITAVAKTHFSSQFPFHPDVEIKSVTRQGEQVEVRFNKQGKEQRESFDYALVATGRRPNVDKLNLEVLGLDLDKTGLPPFDSDSLQVDKYPIFLAGDVNHQRPLLHEAVDEGKIAAFNAAFHPYTRPAKRRSPLSIVFTQPQIATVGSRFVDLPPVCTAVGEVSFENQGRSRVILQNVGKLRIYADYQKGLLLGAEMFGPRTEHLAHLLAWAHQQNMTIAQMLEMPFYHPVIEEGLRTALRKTAQAIRQGPPNHADCFAADLVELTG